MDKRLIALISVILGLLVGVIGNVLFFRQSIGLSFPLFVLIALGILLGFARLARSHSNRRNLWIILPLAFFAVMVAVRADPTITALNMLAVVWLGVILLHYRPLPEALDEESLSDQVQNAVTAGVMFPFKTFDALRVSTAWMREKQPLRETPLRSIGRGLLIALPVVIIFGVLLMSADAVFADIVNSAMNLFSIRGANEILQQAIIVLAIGWLACGGLVYGVLRQRRAARVVHVGDQAGVEISTDAADPLFAEMENERKAERKKHPFLLSMVEAGIVIGAVDVMFGLFVLIQFAYFFGGQANITLERGWTYAEYARRGFFELVAVSVLTLGLILWLDRVTVRSNTRQQRIFRGLAVVIVVLTGIMLISAAGRMSLYEEAYGFTHLRVYTHVFMLWLGVLFAVFLLALFRPARHIFSFGVTLCVMGFLVTINLMNVDGTIARQNIARTAHGYELDTRYLFTLSADAVPMVLPLYQAMNDFEDREEIVRWLRYQWFMLDSNREDTTLFSSHLSRETAWQMLSESQGIVPN
jgi:preprotein translocase subunit SecG